MITKSFEGQKYIAPTWNEMGDLCFRLCQKILAKDVQIDRIIALAKGGLTWSRTVADYLAIENLSVTQIKFYSGIGETNTHPIILQSLSVSIEKEIILIFDDVADSGETLRMARDYLLMCGAKYVFTATLFTKIWIETPPMFTGDYTDAWILFPHEIRESIFHLSKKWKKATKKEKQDRFLSFGFNKEQVKYFLK